LGEVITELSEHRYNQVLLECGPTLGSALLLAGYIDELIVYRAPNSLGAEGTQLFDDEQALLAHSKLISQIAIGPDTKSHYLLTKVGG
jgi:diaminohydroxyphosphoribosylaminopyrimidine deaminase/5-amino-6-(5-phosphoribosylamino)uracil reductase